MIRFGYPSSNLTLGATTGRSLRLANLSDADRVRLLVRANLEDAKRILCWNAEHKIHLFRFNQALIPFGSHPAFPYDWRDEHGGDLQRVGSIARDLGARLSFHPGQYIQPGNPQSEVVQRSIEELRYVAGVLEILAGQDAVIVLHLGGTEGNRQAAMKRIVEALETETEILQYLALENDERTWTVEKVVEVARELKIPAIVDAFHHTLNPGSLSLQQALNRAFSTWPTSTRPKVHLSSQDPDKQAGAHAFQVFPEDFESLLDSVGQREVDIMVEAKGKERAVLPLQNVMCERTMIH